jgi:hypothetical protein
MPSPTQGRPEWLGQTKHGWPTPPQTLEEHVQHIAALGQHLEGCIRFMCQVGSRNGTSAEAKERAVKAVYERMIIVESQLFVSRSQRDIPFL